MLCDYHVHLEQGPYTLDWLQQFLQQAKQAKLAELGIVEHLYRFREARHLFHNDWVEPRQQQSIQEYLDLLTAAKKRRLPVRMGLEVDYIPGTEAELGAFLRELPLDFVIGSVHWLGDFGFDTDPAVWDGKDVLAVYEEYYRTLAQAVQSGLFDVLGHPGNIGYFGHQPRTDDLDRLENEFVQSIKQCRTVIEINTGGLLRPAHVIFPRLALVRKLRAAELDLVLGSDAHRPQDVGHAFPDAVRLLKQMGFICLTRFNRHRTSFPAI